MKEYDITSRAQTIVGLPEDNTTTIVILGLFYI
jgi:hypothetical protein